MMGKREGGGLNTKLSSSVRYTQYLMGGGVEMTARIHCISPLRDHNSNMLQVGFDVGSGGA